jgi:hypothetical protein
MNNAGGTATALPAYQLDDQPAVAAFLIVTRATRNSRNLTYRKRRRQCVLIFTFCRY